MSKMRGWPRRPPSPGDGENGQAMPAASGACTAPPGLASGCCLLKLVMTWEPPHTPLGYKALLPPVL